MVKVLTCVLPAGVEFYSTGFDSSIPSSYPRKGNDSKIYDKLLIQPGFHTFSRSLRSKGTWVSMGIYSDGSYGIQLSLIYSFLDTCHKGNQLFEGKDDSVSEPNEEHGESGEELLLYLKSRLKQAMRNSGLAVVSQNQMMKMLRLGLLQL
ncbi:hypothetical protein L1987_74847 [Smallanthus sonchifolius]|uniref:Uncharacterized protein n=1 Tax=Smallanthus sonchifolius TaxID=185202 RepID=A0ACB9A513_9ASTR|nr:hypothetical protein L1987_74847 [Smallanthus sonchifolius]